MNYDETPNLDAARERGYWENDEERERALEEATNSFIKEHMGAYCNITYFGGFYDGQRRRARKPLKKQVEVALPPPGSSDGCYTTPTEDIQYQAYYLRILDGQIYYVYEESLYNFAEKFAL